jgi:hypothetical protein
MRYGALPSCSLFIVLNATFFSTYLGPWISVVLTLCSFPFHNKMSYLCLQRKVTLQTTKLCNEYWELRSGVWDFPLPNDISVVFTLLFLNCYMYRSYDHLQVEICTMEINPTGNGTRHSTCLKPFHMMMENLSFRNVAFFRVPDDRHGPKTQKLLRLNIL